MNTVACESAAASREVQGERANGGKKTRRAVLEASLRLGAPPFALLTLNPLGVSRQSRGPGAW